MSNTKLAISICNGGTIKTNTILCLLDAFSVTPIEKHILAPIGGFVHHSRNISVNMAKERGATHLMFIDNDMVFPPHGINQLLEANKDIIGANYHERGLPLNSTVKLADKAGNLLAGREDNFPKVPFKVYAVATGFMLINLSVLEKLEKPYFDVWDNNEFCTDDFYFCKKAGKAGVEVWCDPTLVVKHIGDFLY